MKAFEFLDMNDDGKVSKQELTDVLGKVGLLSARVMARMVSI